LFIYFYSAMSDVSPEQLFLRYAVPCSFVLQQKGEVDEQTVVDFELAAMDEKQIDRKVIERVFHRAVRRMGQVANELDKDVWDCDVIREYFLRRHNQIIDEGVDDYAEAPETLKELCKVQRAKVVSKHPNFLVVTLPNGKTRTVIPPFVKDAVEGDEIIIHYGYGVERAGDLDE